jgi:tetratricopeptide (TPR) repeat protein
LRRLLPAAGVLVLLGCAAGPEPPPGCAFAKALPSEDFYALALRTLGDPERGPELAALNRVGEDVKPAGIEGLVVPAGADSDQPPSFDTLEEGGGGEAWLAASRFGVRGDTAGAAALLESALQEDPYRPRLRFLLGLLRFREGESWRAEVQLRAAAYLAPTDARPHLALALLYGALDRGDEARRELSVALALDPTDDRAWAAAALLALAGGDSKDAVFALGEFLRLGPGYGPEREFFAEMLALVGEGLDPLDPAWRSGRLPVPDLRAPVLDPPAVEAAE